MNTIQLARKRPDAHAALPETYQADSCLYFYVSNGIVYAKPAMGQEHLGRWTMKYDKDLNAWVGQ